MKCKNSYTVASSYMLLLTHGVLKWSRNERIEIGTDGLKVAVFMWTYVFWLSWKTHYKYGQIFLETAFVDNSFQNLIRCWNECSPVYSVLLIWVLFRNCRPRRRLNVGLSHIWSKMRIFCGVVKKHRASSLPSHRLQTLWKTSVTIQSAVTTVYIPRRRAFYSQYPLGIPAYWRPWTLLIAWQSVVLGT